MTRTNKENAIVRVTGTAVAVRGNDIDTDQIIPARYMKVVTFDGLGEFAFYDARRNQDGSESEHPFNDERYRGASILLANRNFGCGSSREHAPQALLHAGITAVVGESFAEIFAGNCNALGMATVTVEHKAIEQLMSMVESDPSLELQIDLEAKNLTAGGLSVPIFVPESYRKALVDGQWDSTALLLSNAGAIDEKAKTLPYIAGF